MYADIEALWRTTLERNPACWMAHNNLGVVLLQKGKINEAIAHYRTALEMQPDYSDAAYNLGNTLLQNGEIDGAIWYFQEALKISPSYMAHEGLGTGLARRGEVHEAIFQFQAALKLRPNDPDAHSNLAVALIRDGRVDEAIAQWEESLKIRPDNAQIKLPAVLLRRTAKEAATHWQKVWNYSPTTRTPPTILASPFHKKATTEAIAREKACIAARQCECATNLACPRNFGGPSDSGWSKAVEFAQEALQLTSGNDPRIFRLLAAAYAESGRFSEAINTAQRGRELASSQGNSALANELERNIALYRTNSPLRDIRQTEAKPSP